MANDKSAAQLEREIEVQRSRVENTIDQIQEKLSPGQLVDELLAYTKGGGGEFVSSLQRNVTANPLPVALLGVSLIWLMAKPAATAGQSARDPEVYEDLDYPVTAVTGSSLQRLGYRSGDDGQNYSEFADDAGKKYRAPTDAQGRRIGHFMDEAGNSFRGFTDASGKRIEHFRDEAGNLLDEASGWASHTWQKAREKMHDARDAIGSGSGSAGAAAGRAGDAVSHQAERVSQMLVSQFRDQPLVGGALAFAVGAALGSSLPHTSQEDALIGEASDALKDKVGDTAADVYEQGREKAEELYETASHTAGDLYQQAKDGLAGGAEDAQRG